MVLESFPNLHPVVFLQSTHYFCPNSVRLSFDLVASLIFFDFNSTADSDGIPPMKAFQQCRFGWDSSDEGFPAMPALQRHGGSGGCTGAAGPAPDVRHQPPGKTVIINCHYLLPYNNNTAGRAVDKVTSWHAHGHGF